MCGGSKLWQYFPLKTNCCATISILFVPDFKLCNDFVCVRDWKIALGGIHSTCASRKHQWWPNKIFLFRYRTTKVDVMSKVVRVIFFVFGRPSNTTFDITARKPRSVTVFFKECEIRLSGGDKLQKKRKRNRRGGGDLFFSQSPWPLRCRWFFRDCAVLGGSSRETL